MRVNEVLKLDDGDIKNILITAFDNYFGSQGSGSVTELLNCNYLSKDSRYRSFAEIFAREYKYFKHDLLTSSDSDLTIIPDNMYTYCELERLVIPERITAISEKAFEGNEFIKSIVFANENNKSLCEYNPRIISYAKAIEEVHIPWKSSDKFTDFSYDVHWKIYLDNIYNMDEFEDLLYDLSDDDKLDITEGEGIDDFEARSNNIFINMGGAFKCVAELYTAMMSRQKSKLSSKPQNNRDGESEELATEIEGEE